MESFEQKALDAFSEIVINSLLCTALVLAAGQFQPMCVNGSFRIIWTKVQRSASIPVRRSPTLLQRCSG